MAFQGVDLTAEAGDSSTSISWHDPHPIFVIILVGPEESPFGIQKALLCAQSPYYRDEFAKHKDYQVEHVVKLPDATVEMFGCFQNFIYTGQVYDKRGGRNVPDYPLLMGVWKLATKLRMAPLRVGVLDAMAERRQLTSSIPGIPLLIQAWQETEEGSGLRKMLITWTAEHLRTTPDIRTVFSKSLPHEILTELVVAMSEYAGVPASVPHIVRQDNPIEVDLDPSRLAPNPKKRRKSEILVSSTVDEGRDVKSNIKKIARKSEPARRVNRRVSAQALDNTTPNPDADLESCRLLINRMLHGPGFWTRYVGYFKDPVDPVKDGAPNYFDVVKRPMDLKTIQGKMNRGEYANSSEFETDVRLICQNCYEYWTKEDKVFTACEEFENFFNRQFADRFNAKHMPRVKVEIND